MLEVIEKKIKTAESHISSGAIDRLDKNIASKLRGNILAYSKIKNFSEEQVKSLENRIDEIEKRVEEYNHSKTSSAPSTQRYLTIPQEKLGTVKTNSVRGFTAGVLATLGIVVFMSCNGNKNMVEPTEQVVEEATETELPEAKEEPTAMSEEMKAFSDMTIASIDDALESGINLSVDGKELTESDKETYAKTLTQYRIVANMDDLTKLEYAELFGEMGNPTEDLMNGYNAYNEQIGVHLLTVTSNNMIDYTNLYNNEKDAEVLNESERLIASINDAKSSNERLEASKAWYSYVITILTDTKESNSLSSQAMDTLITHSESYDDLTRGSYYNIQGAYIDDELEHKFNTAKNICLNQVISGNEMDIDVEDITINNLQSEFRISMKNKLRSKYEDALAERTLQLTLENPLNKYNSFNEVVDYVESKVDLTKYVKLEVNHIEKQQNEKGTNAPAQKSKDDSGVSDGNGGIISESDIIQHGVNPNSPTAKQEYEQKVIEETNQQSEESKVVTDESGQTLEGTTEDNQRGYQDGYASGNSGQAYSAPSGNASYNEGYNNGYNAGKADYEALMNNMDNSTSTTYVPVENGPTTITETETIENYTEDVTNTNDNVDYNTTFEPVEGYSMNYDTETTTTFVPIEENSETIETGSIDQASAFSVESELQALRSMRDSLLSASLEEENSKTLS